MLVIEDALGSMIAPLIDFAISEKVIGLVSECTQKSQD